MRRPKRSSRLGVIRRRTKKASSFHGTNIQPCSGYGAAGVGIAPSTMQDIRSRAADAVCPRSGRCVTSSIAVGLPHDADPAVKAGLNMLNSGLSSGRLPLSFGARAFAGLGE